MLQLRNPMEGGVGTVLKTPLLNGAAALPPPAHRGQQRRCPAVSAERPNTPRHLPTASPGKTRPQAQKVEGKCHTSSYGSAVRAELRVTGYSHNQHINCPVNALTRREH